MSPGSDLPAPLASAVLEHAVDLLTSLSFDGNQKQGEVSSSAVPAPSPNREKDSTGGDAKIPKWFKLGSSMFTIDVSPCPPCDFLSQRSDALHPDGIIKPHFTL